MCTALYMMVLYDRACVGPTTKTSDEISIICFFRLILQAKSFVLFDLWNSSCFEVKCWIHTFPKWCSHIAMWILILLDHRGRHVNSFPTYALLFEMIPSFSPSARSILSFSQWCSFQLPQVAFVFPPTDPFFLKDSEFLIKYPSYGCEVSSFFSFNVLPGVSYEDSNGASSSSFVILFFSGEFNSSFVDHIFFLVSNVLSCRCTS